MPASLNYARASRLWFPWRRLLIIAAAAALVYWRLADWWAYAYLGGPNPAPKFRMPWWWQIIESASAGFFAAAVVWLVWWAIRRACGGRARGA